MSYDGCVYLKAGRDTAIRAGHPWVFSGAVARAENAVRGDIVRVMDATGEAVGIGTYHPGNTIRVRMIADDPGIVVDDDFFAGRLKELAARKRELLPEDTDGFRIANADSDYLPGLIVDTYASCIVFQIHTAGMENLKNAVVNGIEALRPEIIVERSDVEARRADGLSPVAPRVVKGAVSAPVEFREAAVRLLADPLNGQKTGFYLDQRQARMLATSLAPGRRIMNLFSYTGGTGLAAALAGATEVISVDSSTAALSIAKDMFRLNGLDPADSRYAFVEDDVFDFLAEANRTARPATRRPTGTGRLSTHHGRSPLLLICDPPPFARHRNALEAAKKAYLRLNRLSLELLEPGDLFLTSSCSGLIDRETFSGIVRHAAGFAHKRVAVLKELAAPPDHTNNLAFPEGSYLKTMLLGVTR